METPFPISYLIVFTLISALLAMVDDDGEDNYLFYCGIGWVFYLSVIFYQISIFLLIFFIIAVFILFIYLIDSSEKSELIRKREDKLMVEQRARDYTKNRLETVKNKCNTWLEKNMDELKSIAKETKSIGRKIDTRLNRLYELNEEYLVPRCSKCNNDSFNLIDLNPSATGMELMCIKCSKKFWIHSKQDQIKNGNKYVIYLEEYFDFHDYGYELCERYEVLQDEYDNIWCDAENLRDNDDYFNEMIEYEERYTENGKLKRGQSYHPLDPYSYSVDRTLPQPEWFFEQPEVGEPDREYYWLFSHSKERASESTKKKNKRKPIAKSVQREVWKRDEGKCVECGSNEKLEFDHIIPVSKGGANTVRNIQLLCEKHNRSKSNKIG